LGGRAKKRTSTLSLGAGRISGLRTPVPLTRINGKGKKGRRIKRSENMGNVPPKTDCGIEWGKRTKEIQYWSGVGEKKKSDRKVIRTQTSRRGIWEGRETRKL